MVIPGNLPSQLCVLDSSQQLYALLFLASSQVQPILFPSKLPEKLLRSSTIFFFSKPPFVFRIFAFFFTISIAATFSVPLPCCHLQPSLKSKTLCSFTMLSPPTISATTTFPSLSSAPLNGLRDPLLESSSTCQSPIAVSKSEVDSLWPLRM